MRTRFIVTVITFWLITAVSVSMAQGTCPMIVEQALQAVGDNCNTLERNNTCYGYNLVSAEFAEAVDDDFFVEPADTASLEIVESIQTAEMNTDLSQWGVAVMSLQANIPNSIPGQAVKFVLLGDVAVESESDPTTIDSSLDTLDATLIEDTNTRSAPGLNANVFDAVTVGQTISLDGQNADGDWYRTVVDNRIGWIAAESVESDSDLTTLPVIDNQRRSLMQSFYLRTGIGTPTCDEAPRDTLVIQGPQGIEVDFTINGADIRIGSTITARILPPGNILEFTVIDGTLIIPGGGPDGEDLVLTQNERTTACLSDADDLGADGNGNDRIVACDWTEPESVDEAELSGSFCVLEGIPDVLLNYAIELDCEDEEPVQIIIQPQPPNQPIATDTPEPEVDEMLLMNLCYVGNAWGDGRCNTEYDWQAGFYYGLYEAGKIRLEDIPEPYYIEPTPIPTDDDDKKKSNPIVASLGCGASINDYEVSVSAGATGDTTFTVTYTDSFTTTTTTSGIQSLPSTFNFFLPAGVGSTAQNVTVTTDPSGATRNLGNRDCN